MWFWFSCRKKRWCTLAQGAVPGGVDWHSWCALVNQLLLSYAEACWDLVATHMHTRSLASPAGNCNAVCGPHLQIRFFCCHHRCFIALFNHSIFDLPTVCVSVCVCFGGCGGWRINIKAAWLTNSSICYTFEFFFPTVKRSTVSWDLFFFGVSHPLASDLDQ